MGRQVSAIRQHPPVPPKEKSAVDLLRRDEKVILRPWRRTNEPVPIVCARGCVTTDADGNDFLDLTSGYFVNNVGHGHPRVIEAAARQLNLVTQVSGRHTTPAMVDLAEKLVEIGPPSVDKVLFTTGGSESTEFALKMARQYSGKADIAAIENAFHGLTLGALAACGNEDYRASAAVPLGNHVYRLPTPYCYRCPFARNCETQCLDQAEQMIGEHPQTAALLAEPVQSSGGIRPSAQWWARVDDLRKRKNLLLILDEVQTGLGRTGKMFAREHYGLEPDIMLAGKGLSGGVGSLGAVLVREEVGRHFYAGTTPTSAGNAVSAAAGLALIEVLLSERIIENAAKMGTYFSEAVEDLNDPFVGEIRFTGLLGGVELVFDRETKEPLSKPILRRICDSLHADGMLLTVSGPLGNVLRLQPPLVITRQEIDRFVAAFRVALARGRTI